jgi:hypothetical protein
MKTEGQMFKAEQVEMTAKAMSLRRLKESALLAKTLLTVRLIESSRPSKSTILTRN